MNTVSIDSALTRREMRDMFALFPTGVAIVTALGLVVCPLKSDPP